MNSNANFIPLSIISGILLTLVPISTVYAQMSPWSLFQQLCKSGGLAIGPQCQNLAQQQLGASTLPSSSSSLPSSTCQNRFTSLCTQDTTTGSTTTSSGTCPDGFTLQGGFCVPTTSSSSLSTASICPTNYIFQNGVCMPITTTQTPPLP